MISKTNYPSAPRHPPEAWTERIADGLFNILLPDSCICCSAPVARLRDHGVCDECWVRLLQLRIEPPFCPSCGIPFPPTREPANDLCIPCSRVSPDFSSARSFGYYTAELRRIIHQLKFSGRQDLAQLLAPLLLSTFFNTWRREEVDAIIPVPLHSKRLRERGFNQAALIGKILAQVLACPFLPEGLRRTRLTAPQVGLSDPGRVRNVRGAFLAARSCPIVGMRILVVDDVLTTGATAGSAARALLDAGAARVSVLSLARTVAEQD